jgi:hypothetical protein
VFRCVLAIIALSVALVTGPEAASKWLRVKAPHVVVLGDGNPRTLKQVALRFEQVRDAVARQFPKVRQKPGAPVQVIVFGSERAYQPFRPVANGKRVEVDGAFVTGPGATYVSLRSDAGDSAYPTVFHGYTHLLVLNTFGGAPVWLDEGLAEYYGSFAMTGDHEASIGKPLEPHLQQLRGRLLSLAELVAVERDSTLYNESDRRTIFFAESWALAHYLLTGNPARRPQVTVFLEKYASGVTGSRAIQDAFGVDEAALERELRGYVQRQAYQPQVVTFTDTLNADRDFTTEPVAEADAEATLADLLLHMNRLEEAGVRAQRATGLVQDHPRGLAVLGRVKNRQGADALARTLLEESTKSEPNDPLPFYYRAFALLRPEGVKAKLTIDQEAARTAATLLEKAVSIQPDLADAQSLLAYARLVAGNAAGAVAPATAAYELSARDEYALLLAEAQIGTGQFDSARPLLDAVAERGATSEVRKSAGELLKRVHLLERVPRGRLPAAETPSPAEPVEKPEPAETEPAPSHPMLVLRTLQDGETRVEGTLTAIECASGKVTVRVETAEGPLALEAARFEDIEFISYRDDLQGQVKCGVRKPAERVQATWRPGTTATQKRAVAIEFMPDDAR